MRALLESRGHVVSTHMAGTDAVKRILKEKPDLVLLDILLPGATGWSILNQLKSRAETKDIPILVCTAAIADLEMIQSGLQLLGVDSVAKPFDIDDLLQKIGSNLAAAGKA